MTIETITIEVSQKLREDFLRFMQIRLMLEDLFPDINPADAILILVAKALMREKE